MILDLAASLNQMGEIAADLRASLLAEADRASGPFKAIEEKLNRAILAADGFSSTLRGAIDGLTNAAKDHEIFKTSLEEVHKAVSNYHGEHLKAMGALTGDLKEVG